ncbi:class I SAM-dependent methyltransferase [Paenibacillus hamazuiensis]|uniref:class I SAM-dependent methyltransferase n=1 Tax=Paenibacillus hamazuiensis TaxID=2936508 RepID=UPI00200C5498|nr:class I SAM-dependent methyltransferase [Paenibacillus hamazuiensis]
MNELDLKQFYDRVGILNGWNFNSVKCISEGVKWDFSHEVSCRCKKSDILLDIGTGGGEALLAIAEAALLLVGIDNSGGMIEAAKANAEKSGKSNVRILQMDSGKLHFPDGFFNVVSCRHAPFDAKEAARVMADGGMFLTQQVGEGDKQNLKLAFGRGQSLDQPDGTLKNKYIGKLREAGFMDIQSFEYDAAEYFQTYEDLVFLLKHTPIIPDFGEHENDFAVLEKFIKEHQTNKGIQTNSKRFMITARK